MDRRVCPWRMITRGTRTRSLLAHPSPPRGYRPADLKEQRPFIEIVPAEVGFPCADCARFQLTRPKGVRRCEWSGTVVNSLLLRDPRFSFIGQPRSSEFLRCLLSTRRFLRAFATFDARGRFAERSVARGRLWSILEIPLLCDTSFDSYAGRSILTGRDLRSGSSVCLSNSSPDPRAPAATMQHGGMEITRRTLTVSHLIPSVCSTRRDDAVQALRTAARCSEINGPLSMG